jgi:hypothetical protein
MLRWDWQASRSTTDSELRISPGVHRRLRRRFMPKPDRGRANVYQRRDLTLKAPRISQAVANPVHGKRPKEERRRKLGQHDFFCAPSLFFGDEAASARGSGALAGCLPISSMPSMNRTDHHPRVRERVSPLLALSLSVTPAPARWESNMCHPTPSQQLPANCADEATNAAHGWRQPAQHSMKACGEAAGWPPARPHAAGVDERSDAERAGIGCSVRRRPGAGRVAA